MATKVVVGGYYAYWEHFVTCWHRDMVRDGDVLRLDGPGRNQSYRLTNMRNGRVVEAMDLTDLTLLDALYA